MGGGGGEKRGKEIPKKAYFFRLSTQKVVMQKKLCNLKKNSFNHTGKPSQSIKIIKAQEMRRQTGSFNSPNLVVFFFFFFFCSKAPGRHARSTNIIFDSFLWAACKNQFQQTSA